ncbi:hypothetical protein JAAARDRAFT_58281 [Jaapia argillacea MUCL 33604]|uniref:Protein kinase domain-containing protein n=1 Tax=Jaapia argillacea MUCL 33604 TaxID=933084 RepID=A0A067PSH6_9AGAM|nr:hypothetical protein JAAARDRAFT_58281 [Jaapia argillacea MUCL 33604]
MLQYTVQPFSSPLGPQSKHASAIGKDRSDYLRSNDSNLSSTRPLDLPRNALSKRQMADSLSPPYASLSHPHTLPLSISTKFPPSPVLPTAPALPSPQLQHKHIPRSPYLSSPRLPPSPIPRYIPDTPPASSRQFSSASSGIQDILSQGDLVGEGLELEGEAIRVVPIHNDTTGEERPREFEVVRRLGTGSYAVVYLVREVLSRRTPSLDSYSPIDSIDMDYTSSHRGEPVEYGQEFALKCLSKANLDEEALNSQMSEAHIHQSLPSHPNIVTLHRTLETRSFLLLLLEFVPGEDLFYFLEQARDHYETDPCSTSSESLTTSASRTPPTPGLLSSLNDSQLLSRTRLKLIASMFSQMCEAVATCHATGVYHRDIKPENFIVTDGWTTLPDGSSSRKVVVKLTDFGLSTRDRVSFDMDCGSAPYMAYECRNNVAPTYLPRGADVWSLGIVLINMLYHFNPWTDTTEGACSSFEDFRQRPVTFLLQRFTGMTLPVAEFLANRVFCVLEDPSDDFSRVSAHEFGVWVKDLPSLLGAQAGSHSRRVSISSVQGFPISSVPPSRRPASRQASISGLPLRPPSRSMSRAASLGPTAFEADASELSTVLDQDEGVTGYMESLEEETGSRSTSTKTRGKRGARKSKGATQKDDTLETLASASQSLAREISRAKASSGLTSMASPTDSYASLPPSIAPITPTITPTVTKKPSKWKLSFGKSSSTVSTSDRTPVEEVVTTESGRIMSATASNVTSLLMGLEAPSHQVSSQDEWGRGRHPKELYPAPNNTSQTWGQVNNIERWANGVERRPERGVSPTSTRSGRPLASSASSTASSNWRSSISTNSSAGASSSAFTKYSNASARSVSTVATSVSSTSWRSPAPKHPPPPPPGRSPYGHDFPRQAPPNVKLITGIPWELGEFPRQPNDPAGDIFGAPPVRKARTRKPKNQLDTISERPGALKAPVPRLDASTSTTDLNGDGSAKDGEINEASPKKVQKGQINALAKMLSALRR